MMNGQKKLTITIKELGFLTGKSFVGWSQLDLFYVRSMLQNVPGCVVHYSRVRVSDAV